MIDLYANLGDCFRLSFIMECQVISMLTRGLVYVFFITLVFVFLEMIIDPMAIMVNDDLSSPK